MKFYYCSILISSVCVGRGSQARERYGGSEPGNATATVALDSPAPDGGLQITLTSKNPAQLLLSARAR